MTLQRLPFLSLFVARLIILSVLVVEVLHIAG